jgi:hypothetical protein
VDARLYRIPDLNVVGHRTQTIDGEIQICHPVILSLQVFNCIIIKKLVLCNQLPRRYEGKKTNGFSCIGDGTLVLQERRSPP